MSDGPGYAELPVDPTEPERPDESLSEPIGRVAVAYDRDADRSRAEELARDLGLPVSPHIHAPHPLLLVCTAGDNPITARLELRVNQSTHPLAGGHGVFADLAKLDTSSPAGRSLKTPLLKAVGINKRSGPNRPRVLDATAGLGEDTWLLAAAGCEVTALERHPVVHALLEDALRRARATAPDITDRIALRPCADAADCLREHAGAQRFDVVLIDPMFPGADRRKTTERKPMRVLRWLVGDDADAEDLLGLAMKTASKRVVVKRPRFAAHLAGVEPTAVHAGRGLRFEVYPTT